MQCFYAKVNLVLVSKFYSLFAVRALKFLLKPARDTFGVEYMVTV